VSGRTVSLAGTGPAAEAVRAALDDADAELVATEPDALADPDPELAVAVGITGDESLVAANAAARAADCPLILVEIGGLGGQAHDDVGAAVVALAPDGACYDCLRRRVERAPGTPSADKSDVRLAGAHAGRRAVSALDGEFESGVFELPGARPRTLLPDPDCACAPAPDSLSLSYRERGVDAAADAAERGVDRRVGVVAAAGERDSFPAPYYLAQLRASLGEGVPEQAAGVDADWDAAYVKALGEAYERYAAARTRGPERTAEAEDLPNAVPVERFVRPDDAPAPPSELSWTPGLDLHDGSEAWLPTEFVRFPPADERLRPAITTGLGLGSSTVDAVRSGLSEVVERDATMLSWYSTYEALGLSVETERFDTLRRRANAEDLSVQALLVTGDVDVPVVAVAVHRDDWPAFAVGSAAGLSPAGAAESALCEALQNWMELRALGRDRAGEAGGAVARYADFPREVHEFVAPETTVPAAEVGPTDPPAGEDALDALLERVADAGLDAYAARVTTRDVAAMGFEAVRVLVPAAQPLFVSDSYFGERAREVPRELGFRPRLDRPFHPYP